LFDVCVLSACAQAGRNCGEANLDVQLLSSTARGAQNYFVTTGSGGESFDPFTAILMQVCRAHTTTVRTC
jgi:hypothetical protein